MPYIYQTDTWCDSCGKAIANEIMKKEIERDSYKVMLYQDETMYDSWDYPKYMSDNEESDSPQHCAAHEDCLEYEELPSGRRIGALLSTSLTDDGARYVKEKVADGGEVADFWREQFDWIDFD